MYLKLKDQKNLINQAIKKEESYRRLGKKLGIPGSSILRYRDGGAIPENRALKIIDFLQLSNLDSLILERFESNFRQKIGGQKCVLSKKEKGTFERDMKFIQKRQSKKLKEWHRLMKKNKPREYYELQYSRFKKVGNYKYKTIRGELVRNLLENDTANILHKLGINYQYEPLIKCGNKYFFPDFLINDKIVIECTEWRGEMKAYKLKEKISYLRKRYKVFVIIPKSLYRYYKIIDYYLILGLDNFASVAQTFVSGKT